MTTAECAVTFVDGGYCSQLARLVGRRSWSWTRFHAVYLSVEHPQHGASLIDTGYSRHFQDATKPFPQRLHRWATPVRLHPQGDPPDVLRSLGIDSSRIRRVFLSHFHSDHIGGLRCFPEAELIYRDEPLARLLGQPTATQVRHGFLKELLPPDLAARSCTIAESRFAPGEGLLEGFSALDYWGDGSLWLVDLPGHADGHTGYFFRAAKANLFYIVDACWDLEVMLAGRRLPAVSRRFQHNYAEYEATQQKLRRLAGQPGLELVACHCPRTLSRVRPTPA